MPDYRIPVLEHFEYQPAVIDKDLATPPGSPAVGDRYIVGASATGDWLGHDKEIAYYYNSQWNFDTPMNGMLTFVSDESAFYFYTAGNWALLIEEIGLGDMLKSVYDTDDNGIVDKAESLDDGAGNVVTAAEAKGAVDNSHTHTNKAILDAIEEAFTTALKTAYDDAVTKAHIQGTDQYLDQGGANEVSAAQVKGAVDNSHTHANKAILDAIDVAFTTVLKAQYDEAYNKRAQWNSDLNCFIISS